MRFTEFNIIEARRNPEQNPKISVNEYITRAVASAQPLPDSTFKNIFVSFTELPKLGINPGSHYNTPIGIYAYPGEYVLKTTTEYGKKDSTLTMKELPFAGDKPWANIFRARDGANIINLKRLSEADYNNYCERLIDLLTKIPSNFKGTTEVLDRQNAEVVVLNLMEVSIRFARAPSSYGGRLWFITYIISGKISGNKPAVWTSLFRRIGIDGFVDPGTEVIHPSEPTQAVFFGGNTVDLLDTVPNKYTPRKVASRKELGQERHKIFAQNMQYLRTLLKGEWKDPDERLMALNNFIAAKDPRVASNYFKRIDPKTRLDLIKYNSNLFRDIYKVATGPEFATAFVNNPRLIGKIDSIKPYVSVDEFKQLLKQIIPKMAAISDDVESREIASIIFVVLNDDRLIHKDNELMKLLVDINPRIWSRFYNELGVEIDESIYEHVLKVMYDRNYSKSAIQDVESILYHSY